MLQIVKRQQCSCSLNQRGTNGPAIDEERGFTSATAPLARPSAHAPVVLKLG